MKRYELTVLIHPLLENELNRALDKVKGLIADNGGSIIKESDWGKKKLAYKINKEDFAVYYSFELELPAQAPVKISSGLNIADEILRYLLVLVDEKAERAKARQLEAEKAEDDDSEENKNANQEPNSEEE